MHSVARSASDGGRDALPRVPFVSISCLFLSFLSFKLFLLGQLGFLADRKVVVVRFVVFAFFAEAF